MTTDRRLRIIFGLLSLGLLISLVFKLTKLPGGMILSGMFLGGLVLIAIVVVCLILTSILRLVFYQKSFLTLLSISTSISFLVFHFYLYSPTLKILVPNGYKGEINLILSNVSDNVLTVDSNGIGYIDKWTFENTYSMPIVEQMDGKEIGKNLVGFSTSTFWANGTFTKSNGRIIKTLSFEIVPDSLIGQKQYYTTDLATLVDKNRLITADKK